jgi:hypothetical protein
LLSAVEASIGPQHNGLLEILIKCLASIHAESCSLVCSNCRSPSYIKEYGLYGNFSFLFGSSLLFDDKINQSSGQAVLPTLSEDPKPSFKHKMCSSHIFLTTVSRKRGRLALVLWIRIRSRIRTTGALVVYTAEAYAALGFAPGRT